MNTPKISVCIPVYNCSGFLPSAIESVLKQSFTDFELLIIDNHSTDDTAEVAVAYAAIDTRIRFIANPENIGMVRNWNLCLSEARGTYIKFVFADDLLSSQHSLELMVQVLDSDSSISLIGSSRNIIDHTGSLIKVRSYIKNDITVSGEEIINQCLTEQRNLIGEPTTVMFRKNDAERGFDVQLKQIVDLEMWFYLLEQGNFAYIKEPLSSFRIHPGQETGKNRSNLPAYLDIMYLNNSYINKPYIRITPFIRTYIQFDIMHNILKLYSQDRNSYWKFLWFYPFYLILKPVIKKIRKHLK